MNSGANRCFDRSRSKSPASGNNPRLHLAIRIAIAFCASIFFGVITLVSLFQVMVVPAAQQSDSGELVDIGGGRKIYFECKGGGSPTVVSERERHRQFRHCSS